MRTSQNQLLLSQQGILDTKGVPLKNIPFQGAPVVAGSRQNNKLAIVVDRRQVWTFTSRKWEQMVDADLC